MKKVRQPSVAGMFYPSHPGELKKMVDEFFGQVEIEITPQNVIGIIAPHAGYVYSGLTAAYAFKLLENKIFDKAIVLSPSHNDFFDGSCIFDGDSYITPLGEIPIDKNTADEIVKNSNSVFFGERGHRTEHALEVELPFLQMINQDFSLIPIVMGNQQMNNITDLAESIAKVIDNKTIIVASSDLSHFYSKKTADKFDSIVEENIINFDFEKLQSDLENQKCFACGGGLIVTLMKTAALMNKKNAKVLHRSDSGDISGDNDRVVGYLSAAIYA